MVRAAPLVEGIGEGRKDGGDVSQYYSSPYEPTQWARFCPNTQAETYRLGYKYPPGWIYVSVFGILKGARPGHVS